MPTNIQVKDSGGTWQTVNAVSVKVAGTWTAASAVWIKEGGVWKQVY